MDLGLDEKVEVTVSFSDVGYEGPGFYVYETEYPEDGCVGFFTSKPTAAQLEELCPEYVEEKVNVAHA